MDGCLFVTGSFQASSGSWTPSPAQSPVLWCRLMCPSIEWRVCGAITYQKGVKWLSEDSFQDRTSQSDIHVSSHRHARVSGPQVWLASQQRSDRATLPWTLHRIHRIRCSVILWKGMSASWLLFCLSVAISRRNRLFWCLRFIFSAWSNAIVLSFSISSSSVESSLRSCLLFATLFISASYPGRLGVFELESRRTNDWRVLLCAKALEIFFKS